MNSSPMPIEIIQKSKTTTIIYTTKVEIVDREKNFVMQFSREDYEFLQQILPMIRSGTITEETNAIMERIMVNAISFFQQDTCTVTDIDNLY